MPETLDIDRLLHQLDLVQRVADSHLRLTTQELMALLGLSDGTVAPHCSQIAWRNFVCLCDTASDQGYWTIRHRQQADTLAARNQRYAPEMIFQRDRLEPDAPYRVVTDVLPAELADQVLDFAIAREEAFRQASTDAGLNADRTSLVLPGFPEFSQFIQNALMPHIADSIMAFGLPRVPQIRLETYLNAYPDGTYYKGHIDCDGDPLRTRMLSLVYFLFRRPAAFSGGELVLCHGREGADGMRLEPAALVAPAHNSVVLFPSYVPHEVLPVRVPSGAFADCRFAVTAWVHPAEWQAARL